MKKLITIGLIFLISNVFAQLKLFTSAVPERWREDKKYTIVDKDNKEIISFDRTRKLNVIKMEDKSFYLKKRKELFDSDNNLVATYKKGVINITSDNSVITEKKNGKTWEYFLKDKKILEVSFKYNDNDRNYHCTILCNELDDTTLKTMQMSLGRFNKLNIFTKKSALVFGIDTIMFTAIWSLVK